MVANDGLQLQLQGLMSDAFFLSLQHRQHTIHGWRRILTNKRVLRKKEGREGGKEKMAINKACD